MSKDYNNPFLSILPTIDVHGYNRDMIKYVLDTFINDNIKMSNKKIVIVHGKGEGILKNEIHSLLKRDKRVNRFYLDGFNIGQTIIELK
ncbi:MAG: Smr/MutS family protein [Bacilli bacterium]|nr:Smr/MutS family protein [Bacilli bacterium]